MTKWPNICCTQYLRGSCIHPAASRTWLSRSPVCIEFAPYDSKDARIGIISRCKVKIPYQKPEVLPSNP
jgi:hypothetical protein